MKEYLSNIFPRIKELSYSLDKKELLVDRPWILLNDFDSQEYIFKRDGKLIISIRGNVELGSWEYLPSAQSILLLTEKAKVLLRHAYFDKGLLLLSKMGDKESMWIFINEAVVENRDVERYLNAIANRELKGVENQTVEVRTSEDKLFDLVYIIFFGIVLLSIVIALISRI